MLKEIFIGRKTSEFRLNAIVKAFIVSETFLWSAWNFVIPIFPIFIASHVSGGSIAVAASAYSAYLIMRLFADMCSGRFLLHANELRKFLFTITGLALMSFSYLGFAYATTISQIFLFYAIAGIGVGISYPAKLSIFSAHLDSDKATLEWGALDTIVVAGTALSASLGGFIATEYGFPFLFILASGVSILSIVPYILYISGWKKVANKIRNKS